MFFSRKLTADMFDNDDWFN